MTDHTGSGSEQGKPEVLIYTDVQGYIKLQWTRNFGDRNSTTLRYLENTLEAVPGVEYVKMKRYSASLEIADHVITPQQALEVIGEALTPVFSVIPLAQGRI